MKATPPFQTLRTMLGGSPALSECISALKSLIPSLEVVLRNLVDWENRIPILHE